MGMECPILMIERRSLLLGITETQRVVQVNFRSHLKVGLFVGRDLSCRKCLNDGKAFLASLWMFPQFKLSCFEIESLPTSNFKDWEKVWRIDIDFRKLGVRLGWDGLLKSKCGIIDIPPSPGSLDAIEYGKQGKVSIYVNKETGNFIKTSTSKILVSCSDLCIER